MKNKTITTIGLPVRLEMLIKSHLQLVNARTIDRWAFSDEAGTDVAICDPDSALTAVALKRSRETGLPVCISLVDSTRQALRGTMALHEPLHATEIIELLDRVSGGLGSFATEPLTARPDNSARPAANYPTQFAHKLHALMDSASHDLHLIEAGSMRFCLLPVSRSIFLAEPLGESWLERSLQVNTDTVATPVPPAHRHELLLHFPNRASLIKLLWYAGLQAPSAARSSQVTENTLVSIRRWPDFGSLKHKPVHLRMAAELSRTRMTVSQLAQATKSSIDQVLSFIDACALCNLLNIDVAETKFTTTAQDETGRNRLPVAGTARRGMGFLQSIRMALGMRAV